MTIELDACLIGLGAVCMNQVYAIKFPKNYENYSIVHLEMLNILSVGKSVGKTVGKQENINKM